MRKKLISSLWTGAILPVFLVFAATGPALSEEIMVRPMEAFTKDFEISRMLYARICDEKVPAPYDLTESSKKSFRRLQMSTLHLNSALSGPDHDYGAAVHQNNFASVLFDQRCAYKEGRGISKSDRRTALAFWMRSIELGYPGAMNNLGARMIKGEDGVSQNTTQGLALVEAAIRGRSSVAAINLAIIYAEGIHLPRNLAKARELLDLAPSLYTNGTEFAQEIGEKVYREQLAKQ